MTQESGNKEGRSWKTAAALVFIVVAGAASWWLWARGGDRLASVPAICTQCSAEQTVKVGDAPGLEDWPRECSQCRARHLYMARKCERCGKLIPFKDPKAEKFGFPEECPFCKRPAIGS
jgi:hypothetical protein